MVPKELGRAFEERWCPVLINKYQRRYYVSMDHKIRITVDSDCVCYDQRRSPRPNLRRVQPHQNIMVVEVKSATEYRDLLANVTSDFPMRVSRHSKYQSSVESLLGVEG